MQSTHLMNLQTCIRWPRVCVCTVPPDSRLMPAFMLAVMRAVHWSCKGPDLFSALGMTVTSTLLQVNSRVLEPPELMYDQQFRPGDRGNWDMHGLKFNRPAKLASFAIASFMPSHRCGDPHDPGGLPVCPDNRD